MLHPIRLCLFFLCLLLTIAGNTQTTNSNPFPGLTYRNIGPANQGGRITDIEARANDFSHVYIAVASGGVWKSENAGTSWMPIFDDYATASIGDIALDPNQPETIWVGTGEANNRNSVSWGNGIYKSEDGGSTFVQKGLSSTHQIARVLVHPDNSDDVCVCAIGHLWGYSGDRGLFRTQDGGENWGKADQGLPNDGKTGCTDVVRDPQNPNVLYAAFYHRLRQPWHFHSGGEAGGIYKSTDNGQSWRKLNRGLPSGSTGRIGLAIYEKNPNILMAIIEAESSDDLSIPGSGIYRSEDGGEHWTYVNTYNNRPFYYSQIRINPHDDQRVYVLTTRFMVSEDGGETLQNGSEDQEIHGDFHAMWLDPQDTDRYYIGADKGLSITHDHGQHFRLIDNLPIAQFYRINFDYRNPYYVYGGLQDNGSYAMASFARDARGILSDHNWKMHWGDGQDVAVNPTDWTDMYSSMEKGSFFKYNPQTRDIRRISPSPLNTINHRDYFTQGETDMASASRFNWSAPLMMSPHNPHHIYVGGNHVYKSTDQGTTWRIISPDLSTNHPEKRVPGRSGGLTPDNSGAEYHCSIHSLALSPVQESVIWVGTDDGNVQVSRDGGKNWQNVRSNVPEVPAGLWVSRVEASRFDPARAYLSFDGHRSDHFGTWVFVTHNYGQTWQKITRGFAAEEVVRVIREDPVNANLLFAGTETGVWYSLDQGQNWQRLKQNMPTVSVYDLKIHPRENDLIVGTHGRGIWIMDDISPLQEMDAAVQAKPIHLFDQRPSTLWHNISRGGQRGHFWFAGENPKTIRNTSSLPRAGFASDAVITYYVGQAQADSLELVISNLAGTQQQSVRLSPEPGIHRYYWHREFAVQDYTTDELAHVTEVLTSIKQAFSNSRVNRTYDRFFEAESAYRQRSLLESLTQGYLSFPIDEKYLIPRAEAGSYRLTLKAGDIEESGVLHIRKDPLEEE